MRFRTKAPFLFLLVFMTLQVSLQLRAQDYAIEEMSDEETTAVRPFSISRVVPFDSGLRLFLSTNDPDAIASLLAAGAFQAQLSDHQAETDTALLLSLGKAVWCTEAGEPVYLAYSEPLPSCDGNPPVRIECFFEVSAALGPGRDLAIGLDPDFLWLIEER
jgi:hypothetical protein